MTAAVNHIISSYLSQRFKYMNLYSLYEHAQNEQVQDCGVEARARI